jgi:hypothetical protein
MRRSAMRNEAADALVEQTDVVAVVHDARDVARVAARRDEEDTTC